MSKVHIVKFGIGIFFVIKLLLLLTLFSTISLILIIRFGNNDESKTTQVYRYVHYNPITKESSSGLAKMKNTLEKDFESYGDVGTGNQYLISKIGYIEKSPTYVCTGSCYCDESSDQDRRSSSSSASSLLIGYVITLVAATSSMMAYRLAKEKFEKECISSFQRDEVSPSSSSSIRTHTCPPYAIRSKNEKCEPEVTYFRDDPALAAGDFVRNKFTNRKFICSGNCMAEDFKELNTEDEKLSEEDVEKHQQRADDFGCDKLSLDSFLEHLSPHEDEKYTEMVERRFQRIELNDFCREQSIDKYDLNAPPVCVGYYEHRPVGEKNPSVSCYVALEPEYLRY